MMNPLRTMLKTLAAGWRWKVHWILVTAKVLLKRIVQRLLTSGQMNFWTISLKRITINRSRLAPVIRMKWLFLMRNIIRDSVVAPVIKGKWLLWPSGECLPSLSLHCTTPYLQEVLARIEVHHNGRKTSYSQNFSRRWGFKMEFKSFTGAPKSRINFHPLESGFQPAKVVSIFRPSKIIFQYLER